MREVEDKVPQGQDDELEGETCTEEGDLLALDSFGGRATCLFIGPQESDLETLHVGCLKTIDLKTPISEIFL